MAQPPTRSGSGAVRQGSQKPVSYVRSAGNRGPLCGNPQSSRRYSCGTIENPLHRSASDVAGFSVGLEFVQEALLERDSSLPSCFATTWSHGVVAQGDMSFVREGVEDLTDTFINAWLSVNPKE
jgi:hypothetical protein